MTTSVPLQVEIGNRTTGAPIVIGGWAQAIVTEEGGVVLPFVSVEHLEEWMRATAVEVASS